MKKILKEMVYKHGLCGGTFDYFHYGHEKFLLDAFMNAPHVTIGISSDIFVSKHKQGVVDSFEQRKGSVITFLKKNNLYARATIVSIDDMYGPGCDISQDLDVLICTRETERGAQELNKKRVEKRLSLLPIVTVTLGYANNQPIKISSTAIRQGKMNRVGKLFLSEQRTSCSYILPFSLRSLFHKPIGTFISHDNIIWSTLPTRHIITVGDEITRSAQLHDHIPDIAVVDLMVKRKPVLSSYTFLEIDGKEMVKHVINPAGTLSQETLALVSSLPFGEKKQRIRVYVKGEEDLLVLPLILAAPLGWFILYGQPNEGIVKVEITETVKETADALFAKLQPRY